MTQHTWGLADTLRRPVTWVVLASVALAGLMTLRIINPDVVRTAGDPISIAGDALLPALSEHVILISIDGLRPDAIEAFGASTLQQLMASGRYTLEARTVFPSKTLPSHASMLTGRPPDEHGLNWNADSTASRGYVEVPTIFELARMHGLSTAAFFSKTKFEHLAALESFDHLQRPIGGKLGLWAADVGDDVVSYLREHRPNLLFVHVGDPDYTGHTFGWMTRLYGRGVRAADNVVANVVRAADGAFGRGNYTLIVTADHGGEGKDHGSARDVDTQIPWIAWGHGVNGSGVVREEVTQMRTAATVLWLLGVPAPDSMTARPVRTAFRDAVWERVGAEGAAAADTVQVRPVADSVAADTAR